MRWFVRGDVGSFLRLALDNLAHLLLINALCRRVLGFNSELMYSQVLPGVAMSLLVGNCFYAWQAYEVAYLALRKDFCALPYGLNTFGLIASVYLVMLPAKLAALEHGATPELAARMAWQAGLIACLGSGLIAFVGGLFGPFIRRCVPRTALIAATTGITLGFVVVPLLIMPWSPFTMGIFVFFVCMGGKRIKNGSAGLITIVIATVIALLNGVVPIDGATIEGPHLYLPFAVIGDFLQAWHIDLFVKYLPIMIAMGLFNLFQSLEYVVEAEKAGNRYHSIPTLAASGFGCMTASLFGSCFSTSIANGHSAGKADGARFGFSILNAILFALAGFAGLFSAIFYVMPAAVAVVVILFATVVSVVGAYRTRPVREWLALAVGSLPGLLAGLVWVFKMKPLDATAVLNAFFLCPIVLTLAITAIIARKFRQAAVWLAMGILLLLITLMRSD